MQRASAQLRNVESSAGAGEMRLRLVVWVFYSFWHGGRDFQRARNMTPNWGQKQASRNGARKEIQHRNSHQIEAVENFNIFHCFPHSIRHSKWEQVKAPVKFFEWLWNCLKLTLMSQEGCHNACWWFCLSHKEASPYFSLIHNLKKKDPHKSFNVWVIVIQRVDLSCQSHRQGFKCEDSTNFLTWNNDALWLPIGAGCHGNSKVAEDS